MLERQKGRLEELLGHPVSGVRQHFLKMNPGSTQALMEAAGFTYDSTFGFHDRAGFRLGSADVVPLWDAGGSRQFAVEEVPIHWMDRTASKYRGEESPDAWLRDARATAEAARAVDGLWVMIWHPYLTGALGYVGAPAAFEALAAELADADPWFATLAECVAWRTARRRLVARHVGADGRCELFGAESTGYDFRLEGPDARPVPPPRGGGAGA